MSCVEAVFIAPEGYPNNMLGKVGLWEIGVVRFFWEKTPKIIEVELVVMQEQKLQVVQMSKVWNRPKVVIGNVELDEVLACLQRCEWERKWSVQNQKSQRLGVRNELFKWDVLIHHRTIININCKRSDVRAVRCAAWGFLLLWGNEWKHPKAKVCLTRSCWCHPSEQFQLKKVPILP